MYEVGSVICNDAEFKGTFEVLRTIAIGKHKGNDPYGSAKQIIRRAKGAGALAVDILEDDEAVYLNTMWPTEKRWLMFKKEQRLRKKVRKDIWTKRG